MAATNGQKSSWLSAGEIARLLTLAAVAAWLLHPFATNRQIGSGDALWYANMLADFCLQWRAGVFPVFAGQTEFAFNGAVYPLRVAPLYQHLGGVLDLLTAHRLSWFALQHLCVIVCGVAGIYSCYFALCSLAPKLRWPAVGFATLYLSCPGVLGTIYTQDLYMTWMTVPFVPLAVYGAVRAFQKDDWIAQVCLAAALAALWLAHSPIALWMTLLAALIQGCRLLFVHRTLAAWKRAIVCVFIFVVLANYPFVSVATLETGDTASAVTSGLSHAERIAKIVREVFPAVLLPVSSHARALSDLQLGYGLWAVLLLAGATLAMTRSWVLGALLAGCALLLVLVLPVPGNEWLWQHLPSTIKRITYYWPMQRFYLLLAGLLVVAGQLIVARWTDRNANAQRIFVTVLGIGVIWSLAESRQFVSAGRDRTASAETTALHQRPENLILMNHAYGLFPKLPPYFSNGVVDPRAEVRLLDRDTFKPIAREVSPANFRPLKGHVDENPGILKLEPTFRLEPGKRYQLVFEFQPRTYNGVLQFTGRKFFREYSLPSSGEALAFGSEPSNAHTLVLWTTAAEEEEIVMRFIPTAPGETPNDYANFGKYSFLEIAAESATNMPSLLPFRIDVVAGAKSWLETPRVFQHGYVAHVDGAPVATQRASSGLLLVPIEAGNHTVTLRFPGPPLLRVAYWAALAAWTMLIAVAARATIAQIRN